MYQFTDDCLIGIEEIDNEHRKLFHMINEAFELLRNPSNAPVLVKNLVINLKDYAAAHFAHEEAYMEKINDPELKRQKREHAAFVTKINSFDLDALTSDTSYDMMEELLTYLVRWLYRHILSSDMMIGKLQNVRMASTPAEDPFAFTDKYRTGIALVDDEHQKLFEIIRDANDLIHEELLHDKYDEIMRILTELRSYTEFHFHDEENYMKQLKYPGLDAQKQAHAAFVERLVDIDLTEMEALDENQQEYLEDLIDFLLGWLTNHILKTDMLIGEFERGLTKK